MTTTRTASTQYRAGYRNERRYFNTLPEAAAHTANHGGPIDKLSGTLFRTISGVEQAAAEAAVEVSVADETDAMDQGTHILLDMTPLTTLCACGETLTSETPAESVAAWEAHIEADA
jgi:hypothetical protein